MRKLPVLSGAELIRILEQHGYEQVRTRGSHVRLYPPEYSVGLKKVTVPLHTQLKRGTLVNIMKDTALTVEDLN
jgi:predicted RNA binding protein YcfA (HicA-like mRNA interferase family)